MDFQTAQQIINSDETIEVLYAGAPVWIESLNPEKKTALVRSLADRGSAREVPVNELVTG
ncbi:H-type small acid-soluble spore protein [Desulfoscipio geothermicus]|uniref:Small acid-soluble spore protein H (Minor) n=1 Tax=Desulfoscipio geothermicus DSM 3669 TaxID=1121426 RepID=A0A1I6DWV0_9FIRM|nr:H-type small acid-soluble spore protein [Desulfoscipio geothermicus]SFR09821.1 small acid-soluble spore protein H (minor) [Desulfoscipio geothermicus DSM 3669]